MGGRAQPRWHQAEPERAQAMTEEDLAPARRVIWDRLLRTAQAACKGGDSPRSPQARPATAEDAAEALGWCRSERGVQNEALVAQIQREREAAAADLEHRIFEETGQHFAMALRVDHLERCSDEFATTCPMRPDHACPRNLREAERENRRQKAHEATLRGVPREIAEACAEGKLPHTTTLKEVHRFHRDGRRLLLLCNDQTGEATQAAGWLIYQRGEGRFVFAHELRFLRRDNPLVHVLMQLQLLVLDNLHDLPKGALELVETLLEQALREQGRKVLLVTRAPAADFLDQFSTRTQELFASHNSICAVTPEQGRLV